MSSLQVRVYPFILYGKALLEYQYKEKAERVTIANTDEFGSHALQIFYYKSKDIYVCIEAKSISRYSVHLTLYKFTTADGKKGPSYTLIGHPDNFNSFTIDEQDLVEFDNSIHKLKVCND